MNKVMALPDHYKVVHYHTRCHNKETLHAMLCRQKQTHSVGTVEPVQEKTHTTFLHLVCEKAKKTLVL